MMDFVGFEVGTTGDNYWYSFEKMTYNCWWL